MLMINLEARLKNKFFIVSMIGAIVLLIQQLGFKDIIPNNYADIVNSVLSILTMLGIVIDPSTTGISDQNISQSTVKTINAADNIKEETKIKATTTAINNTISENSQALNIDNSQSTSSKISVDIPQE